MTNLHCDAGDTVYYISWWNMKPEQSKINIIEVRRDKIIYITDHQVHLRDKDFNKTWFLDEDLFKQMIERGNKE